MDIPLTCMNICINNMNLSLSQRLLDEQKKEIAQESSFDSIDDDLMPF